MLIGFGRGEEGEPQGGEKGGGGGRGGVLSFLSCLSQGTQRERGGGSERRGGEGVGWGQRVGGVGRETDGEEGGRHDIRPQSAKVEGNFCHLRCRFMFGSSRAV